MRFLITTAALLILFASNTSQARAGDMGIGIIIGEPTGICAVTKLNDFNSLNAALAWSLAGNGSLHLHIDDVFYRTISQPFRFYYGGGIRLLLVDFNDNNNNHKKDKDAHLGIRFPFGINFPFTPSPFDAFFEVVPILDLLPGSGFDINAAVGVRYYFN